MDASSSKAILIVDDDEDLADAVRLVATSLTAALVEIASSVESAYERLKQREYDVIVADYSFRMSPLTGIDFWKTLRQSHPKTRFVLMTGYGNEVFGEILQAGLSCPHVFLAKPFSAMQCRKTIEKALAES